MNETTIETTLRYLKAMAHETRLRLLGIVADGEWSVRELAELLDLTEPTISHHLTKLREAELVCMRPVGTTHLYSLNGAMLQRLNRDLFQPERVADLAADIASDSWERKVLRTFLDGERLTRIPEQHKKRAVVLKWLVERFEVDRAYTELEVNAIIKRHHPDTATLRRELVAAKLMRRDNGIYCRVAPPLP